MPAAPAAAAAIAAMEGRPLGKGKPTVSFKETADSPAVTANFSSSARFGASMAMSFGGSQSMPTFLPSAAAASSSSAPPRGHAQQPPVQRPGVTSQALHNFLFPASLENPDVVGRLELFAVYGPTDEEGFLRGGVNGSHAHTDMELKQMIELNCREVLFYQFKDKPRSAVEATVNSLLPVAMAQKYTWADVQGILKDVYSSSFRMDFRAVQKAIFASQRRRFHDLLKRAKGGKPIAPPVERPVRVPFRSQSAVHLMELTTRPKLSDQEREVADTRRMHSFNGIIASMEDQQQVDQLKANVYLLRKPDRLDDRWDRYCAMRRTGRSSYVKARNEGRFNAAMDEGLSNKHPGTSSLVAASGGGSSAAALLGAA